ncbi:MAG: hypothetical protein OSB05_09705 [Akkermansiaceae bacterium]|nr:hypothetical protein [Akkermansiaceae bacterium]
MVAVINWNNASGATLDWAGQCQWRYVQWLARSYRQRPVREAQ